MTTTSNIFVDRLIRTPGHRTARRCMPGLFATLAACASLAASPPTAGGAGGDAAYAFEAGYSTSAPVRMDADGEELRLRWPKLRGPAWDTALLAVTSIAAGDHPWVEILAGSEQLTQYLDPHATGMRWLNLSPLRDTLTPGTPVRLRTHGVQLAAGRGSLRLFANDVDLTSRILVLAPHPDDAEIAAFGLYADRDSTIVTVTAGNAGDMNYKAQVSDPGAHYLLKGYLRAVDSVTVPWQGGIAPSHTANLGYFDARLAQMYRAPQADVPEMYGPNTDTAPYRRANLGTLVAPGPRSNRWEHLVEDLATLLREVNPQLIVMPDPRLDTHTDHQFTAVALVQALQRWQGSARFLLYTNHADNNLYPYGPAGTLVSLPPSATPLSLQRVYSLAIPPALQLRQLFALESMHDLRLAPQEQADCDAPAGTRRPDYPRNPDTDYFRRAPRANELFLLFDTHGMQRVIDGFLSHAAEVAG